MELRMKVTQAVHVLNHDTQSCNRVAANQWLVQFQQTGAAWEVATAILTSDHVQHPLSSFVPDLEVEFFAAQILKRKIQNEGYLLQLGVKDALLNALLVAAKKFSSGPPQLLTQICLALSALILRTVEHGKPIDRLFYSLQNLQSVDNGNLAVLEMLTVLPEEVVDSQNVDCKISSSCRSQYAREVRVGCFSEIPQGSLPTHPLLNFVLKSLQDAVSFDLAIEVLVEVVSRHEGLPQVLLCRVHFLKEMLLLPSLSSGDEKVISGLACLFSEVGQAAPSLIVEASAEALALADALLSCVAFPSEDWEIADSTLQFWSSLASYILGLDENNSANRKHVEDVFLSVFSALLDGLLLRSQVVESAFNEERGMIDLPDGLIHFRMNIVELLVDICQILRSSRFMEKAATRSCFYAGFAAQRNFAEVIAKGEAQGMVSKSIGMMLGITLANRIRSSTSLALGCFSIVTLIHMFCNLKSYKSIQLRTLNPYRASLVFSEYLLSGEVPSIKDVNNEEPLFPAVPFLNTKLACGEPKLGLLSTEAKESAANIEKRLQLGSKLSDVVSCEQDVLELLSLYTNENYILSEHRGRYCVMLKESASPVDMLKALFHVNYLHWLERNAGIIARSASNDCRPGGRLQMSLEYVRREFNHVKYDGELAGWLADGLIARPLTNRICQCHVAT